MNNIVISINRQFGSGGGEIATKLGERLGIKVYDEEILDLIAEDCGYERSYVNEVVEHMTSSLNFDLSGFIGYSMGGVIGAARLNGEDIFASQTRVINKLSEEECIIVGRCSDYILKDKSNVISVFTHGSKEYRENRIMISEGLSHQEALSLVKDNDKFRSKYYSYYCERKWGDAENYSLVLDTEKLSIDTCVDILESVFKNKKSI